MKKQISDIISKYYKADKVKGIEERGDHVIINILSKKDEKIDESMKKEMYNLGVGKVTVNYATKK